MSFLLDNYSPKSKYTHRFSYGRILLSVQPSLLRIVNVRPAPARIIAIPAPMNFRLHYGWITRSKAINE